MMVITPRNDPQKAVLGVYDDHGDQHVVLLRGRAPDDLGLCSNGVDRQTRRSTR